MLTLFDIKRLLNPNKDNEPEDDFRILQSWAEYDDTSSKSPEQRNLNYLCYELEVMNPDTGETTRFSKQLNLRESFGYLQVLNNPQHLWTCRKVSFEVFTSKTIISLPL